MTLHDCERQAQTDGFDRTTFIADFPAQAMLCQWIDAYMGVIIIQGMEPNKCVSTTTLSEMYPSLECSDITTHETSARAGIYMEP